MVTTDSFLVSQLASAPFNTYILENFRLNKAEVSVTVRVANVVGNNQTEPNNSANIDQNFVFMTSSAHGQPWVRHTMLPNGQTFRAPAGLEQIAIESVLADMVTAGQIRQDATGNYYINTIIPSYDYSLTEWRN